MNNILRRGLLTITVGAVASLAYLSPVHAASVSGNLESAPQTTKSHIKIVKETLIERGSPANPRSIAKTHDGGFVVAGSLGGNPAWATRVDSMGHVLWRYVAPIDLEPDQTMESNYVSAVQLPDDSTLLCGSGITSKVGVTLRRAVGLLTHISKTGEVIGQEILDPISDRSFDGNQVRYCVPHREGLAIVAIASHSEDGKGIDKPYIRVLVLDSQARRIADYSFPAVFILTDVVSHGEDLVFLFYGALRESGSKEVTTTRLLRLDKSGATTADRTLRGGGFYLGTAESTSSISLLLELDGEAQLRTLGASLEDLSVVKGPSEDLFSTRSYQLNDGSVVFFGKTEVNNNSYSDSVTWLSPKLRDKEVFMFKPLFANDNVNAVTLSGRPGEFVTARAVSPRGIPGSEQDRTGLVLTIFSIR